MLAALTLLIAAGNPAPPPKMVVALFPLRSLGVPADVVNALEVTLRNEIAQLPEAKLAPDKELLAALKAEPECDVKPACAAAAALKVSAQQIVSGTTSQLGDSFTIDLKLVDVKSGQEIRRATYPVSGSQDALIETLREAAVRLLAPGRYVGALRVEVPGASSGELFLDGKPAGKIPLVAALEGLPPGQHTVRIADDKAREMSTFVQVRFGQTTEARIDLGPPPSKVPAAALPGAVQEWGSRRPWVRPAVYAGAAAAVAAVAVGVVYHLKAYSAASDVNHLESQNALTPSSLSLYRDVDRNTHIARALYVTGAILAAGSGGLLLWDLHGASVQGSF
jgi:hypothetical protein